jgi:hypothetical protein
MAMNGSSGCAQIPPDRQPARATRLKPVFGIEIELRQSSAESAWMR